jgi:hypothetical protein
MIAATNSELEKTFSKYPDVSPFVILKLSMLLRGVTITPAALDAINNDTYFFGVIDVLHKTPESDKQKIMPGSILLRDSTNVTIYYEECLDNPDPFHADWDGENFLLLDKEKVIDTIDFVPRPKYFGMQTSRGVPMESIATMRAQRMIIMAYLHCHLRDTGDRCKFCVDFTDTKETRKYLIKASRKDGKSSGELDLDDIYETVRESLRERGRVAEIYLSGGMDYRGAEMFDNEVERYIRVLQAIGRNFKGRFPSQLMAPAYTKKQLKRIFDETGLTCYAPNIEIWDEEIAKWLVPGKSKWPGHKEWIKRTLDAVEIFGKGNVYTQIVAGAEMARPYGFKSMDDALKSNLDACEFYSKNGVVFVSNVWHPRKVSALGKQDAPPLDYYVRLVKGIHEIRTSYGLTADNDDYKHCGNHSDADLERAD